MCPNLLPVILTVLCSTTEPFDVSQPASGQSMVVSKSLCGSGGCGGRNSAGAVSAAARTPAGRSSAGPAGVASGEVSREDGRIAEQNAEILERVNAQRAAAGRSPLVSNPQLSAMALEQVQLMARHEQISHAVNGQSFSIRLQRSGYPFLSAGENIAEGQRDAAEAVHDWMNSAGHRANILNPEFSETGIAMAVSASGRRYWAQVFGHSTRVNAGCNGTCAQREQR